MKIGLVSPYSMAHAGGVQEIVRWSQEELTRRGHEVVILTPMPRGHADDVPDQAIFIGQSKRIRAPQGTSPDVAVSVNPATISQVLEQQEFDLLHIHEPLVPFLPFQMLHRTNCPVIGTFHAAMPETFLVKMIAGSIRPYVRSILRNLDGLTAVSHAATAYIDNYEHSEVAIIPNGIDLEQFYPPAKRQYLGTTILFVGRLEARKNVKSLLQAFQIVVDEKPDAKLIIAGDGPDRQKLESYVRRMELQNVEFLGRVSEQKKLQLLHEADLFCSPPMYGESFGVVLLEAMACQLPVVAGANPGYQAVLTGEGHNSLVDTTDIQAFATQILRFLDNPQLAKRWVGWAKETVTQYDFRTVIDRYEAYYQDMVGVPII